MKFNAVLYDLEATPCLERQSRVHTICLVPVTVDKNSITRQKGVLICIRDVIKCPEIQHKTDVRTKIAQSVIDVANYGLNVKYMDFYDAIKFMNQFIIDHGGMLIGHNMAGDLEFLSMTQDFVGGKRIIKKKLKDYPDTGMYDPNWGAITRVCTMSLFGNRCPKMNAALRDFVNEHDLDLTPQGYVPLRLATYTQFVRSDPNYRQSHSAVQDTMDLYSVLKAGIKYDGNIIDGHDYLAKPEWLRAR